MAKTAEAIPNNEMLIWARKRSAMSLDIAAQKLHIDPQKLGAWENGEEKPSISQLRKLGDLYKRPLSAFYLPEAPVLPPKLRDLRLMPGVSEEIDWVNLTKEERTARERRAIVIELLDLQEQTIPEFNYSVTLKQDPEEVGLYIREILGITLSMQSDLRTPNDALHFWRAVIESKGVLVFQTTRLPLSTARGFSIADFPLPVIAINRKDRHNARIFSLLHEFVHILLRISGVCDLDYHEGRPPEEQRIEVFCNHAAGAALVPKDILLSMPEFNKHTENDWTDDGIKEISRYFGVSKEVIVRRLLIIGKVSSAFYEAKRESYLAEYKKIRGTEKAGFLPPARDIISAAGRNYVRLVLTSLYNDRISPRDVSNYLGVRLKHLPKIEQMIGFG
jgi:Zn-dependent peptidase ImmA (M78 family)/DNA-binding XRE family transcriptional regulator